MAPKPSFTKEAWPSLAPGSRPVSTLRMRLGRIQALVDAACLPANQPATATANGGLTSLLVHVAVRCLQEGPQLSHFWTLGADAIERGRVSDRVE